MEAIRGKRVTVAGLGRFGGGINVARWLVQQGAHVLVTDKEPAEKLADSLTQLDGLPIEYRLREHRVDDFTSADLVVPSPAIPPSNEYLLAAKHAGVPIALEIGLFIERCPGTIIGVTATKGKSTTTTLLGMMLRTKFPRALVGGNLGGSLLFDLPKIQPDDLVVLELSSYMLEHLRPMRWSPHVAVVGMIGADHLEWHGGSREAYVDAKRNLVRFQRPGDYVVLNRDDAINRSFANDTPAKRIDYGNDDESFELSLPGAHNQLNAKAAYKAAAIFGVLRQEAQAAIKDFKGLPHRLQVVHESPSSVRYVNDSIATIPEAAIAALDSFPTHRVIQIVGGYDAHAPLDALAAALSERAKTVLCIGATGPAIAALMNGARDRVQICGDLSSAMIRAREIATAGDVVLLSTGCKSYDQFVNFEQRGDLFTELARHASGGV